MLLSSPRVGRQGIEALLQSRQMYSSEAFTERARVAMRPRVGPNGDQRLARMAARGERHAFELVFERYNGELYRYCRALLGEPDEAQDALQNTMALALRHLPELEERMSLRGWLYRVAHNEAISILRRRPVPIDPALVPERPAPGPQVELEQRERLRRLIADLRQLPHRHRGALVMRELSGLSYAEIAAAIKTSEAAARQVVYEARESIRSFEVGRDMDCATVRRAISERDGRRLRGRRVRAHLHACASCGDFLAAIDTRRADLAAFCPPLAPAIASAILSSLLGGMGQGGASGIAAAGGASSAATGAAGGASAVAGASGTALGGATGLKIVSIVSAVALGAGAAGIGDGIKSPSGGGRAAASQPVASLNTDGEPGTRGAVPAQRTAPAPGPSQLPAQGGPRGRPDRGRSPARSRPQAAEVASANAVNPSADGPPGEPTDAGGPRTGTPASATSTGASDAREPGAPGRPSASTSPGHDPAATSGTQSGGGNAVGSEPLHLFQSPDPAGQQVPDNRPPPASTSGTSGKN